MQSSQQPDDYKSLTTVFGENSVILENATEPLKKSALDLSERTEKDLLNGTFNSKTTENLDNAVDKLEKKGDVDPSVITITLDSFGIVDNSTPTLDYYDKLENNPDNAEIPPSQAKTPVPQVEFLAPVVGKQEDAAPPTVIKDEPNEKANENLKHEKASLQQQSNGTKGAAFSRSTDSNQSGNNKTSATAHLSQSTISSGPTSLSSSPSSPSSPSSDEQKRIYFTVESLPPTFEVDKVIAAKGAEAKAKAEAEASKNVQTPPPAQLRTAPLPTSPVKQAVPADKSNQPPAKGTGIPSTPKKEVSVPAPLPTSPEKQAVPADKSNQPPAAGTGTPSTPKKEVSVPAPLPTSPKKLKVPVDKSNQPPAAGTGTPSTPKKEVSVPAPLPTSPPKQAVPAKKSNQAPSPVAVTPSTPKKEVSVPAPLPTSPKNQQSVPLVNNNQEPAAGIGIPAPSQQPIITGSSQTSGGTSGTGEAAQSLAQAKASVDEPNVPIKFIGSSIKSYKTWSSYAQDGVFVFFGSVVIGFAINAFACGVISPALENYGFELVSGIPFQSYAGFLGYSALGACVVGLGLNKQSPQFAKGFNTALTTGLCITAWYLGIDKFKPMISFALGSIAANIIGSMYETKLDKGEGFAIRIINGGAQVGASMGMWTL